MELISVINVICTIAAFATTLVISIALLSNYRKNHIKSTVYISLFFLFLATHNIVFLAASLSPTRDLATILFKMTFLGPLGVLFSLIFAESLRKPSPTTARSFIGTLLFLIAFVDGLFFDVQIIREEDVWYAVRLRSTIGYIALLSLFVFSSVFVIHTYYLMYKKSVTKKPQAKLLLLGSILGFLGTIIAMLIELFIFPELVLEFLMIAVASSIVGIAYLRNPYVAYLLVQDIYKVMIIQKSGLLCYSRDLSKEVVMEDSAIAGLLYAMISFGSEVLGVKDRQSEINILAFGDKKIITKFHFDIIGVVITNEVSEAIIDAIERFTVEFWERYGLYIKDLGFVSVPSEADNLLQREFNLLLP